MSHLYLVEIVPNVLGRGATGAVLSHIQSVAGTAGAEFIEAQISAPDGDGSRPGRIFAILEADSPSAVAEAFREIDAKEVSEPARVRLVGADLAELKAARPEAGYLVEWDIPAHIDMDTYLSRKREKSPLYSQIPEVTFLRTYVREDVAKCLCFYDAPDEDAVVRAREIVATPVDRLHKLVPGAGR